MIVPVNYEFRDFFHIARKLTVVCFIALAVGLLLFGELQLLQSFEFSIE